MIGRKTALWTIVAGLLAFGPGSPARAASTRLHADAGSGSAVSRIGGVLANSPVWSSWRDRFVAAEGRVVDTGNHNVSHSEGQGYGMLLAVAAADRVEFDHLWTWTRINLQLRNDNLFAWRWDPAIEGVSDANNATEGDILIAWALAEAADLWRSREYAQAGAAIAHDISRKLVIEAPGIGPVLLPASFGFSAGDQTDGPVVNLSYWIFPAFARLAELAPERDWEAVRRSALAIIDSGAQGVSGLPSDWTSLAEPKPAPAHRFPSKTGYDALRIPLYLGFANASAASRLTKADSIWRGSSDGVPIVNVASGRADETAAGAGFRAVRASLSCASSHSAYPREFYRLDANDSYYPATLHMLALTSALMQSDQCLDAKEARVLQPAGWRPQRISLPDIQTAPPIKHASAPVRQVAIESQFAIASPAAVAASVAAPALGNSGLAVGGMMLVSFFGFFHWRRSKRAPRDIFAETLSEKAPQPAPQPQRSPAPRCLPRNPFLYARGAEALEQRIEIAAAESTQWSRTVGVAFFRFIDFEKIERTCGLPAAEQAVDIIVEALKGKIRPSDAVVTIAPGEIAVCLCLIADAADLQSVGQRLTRAVREVSPLVAKRDNVFGLALFPLRDGTGAQCMEDARRAFHEANPQLRYEPRPLENRAGRKSTTVRTQTGKPAVKRARKSTPAENATSVAAPPV